jgi:3-methyladenine DNA glycosylase Tag
LTQKQYQEIQAIHTSYCTAPPYDYAFFGMRCASATQDVLGQIRILKKRKRFTNIFTTFYPKKIRKRLFRLATKNNYSIQRNEGRTSRKWEKD